MFYLKYKIIPYKTRKNHKTVLLHKDDDK